MSTTVTAIELIDRLVDADTFQSWDAVDEAIVTGRARIGGVHCALVIGDFDYLAGSIGSVAAERITVAFERATAHRLPVIASPSSGGTRMQEGTPAFVQMIKISAAVAAHKQAGLGYLVYLRDPTMGGVLASWGSLGHATFAEPGAQVGLVGPRVFRAIHDTDFPEGVQRAENLETHGVIDAVVTPELIRTVVRDVLAVWTSRPAGRPAPDDDDEDGDGDGDGDSSISAWESIKRSRRPDRPGITELLVASANTVTRLHGTGAGETDAGIVLAFARFGAAPCVLVGHDRRSAGFGPAGLRVYRRAIRLAEELRLPLVSVIDTDGATLSPEGEQGGLAGEIARSLIELVTVRTPTISLLLGPGGGGGALAFLPADRVLCAEHAWLAPLPPEGAATIMSGRRESPAAVATRQRVASREMWRDGIVDLIVEEDVNDPAVLLTRLGARLEYELTELPRVDIGSLLERRVGRYRGSGGRR